MNVITNKSIHNICTLGYANEVGEAFRALVPVTAVRISYVIACGYVSADAASKGKQAAKVRTISL